MPGKTSNPQWRTERARKAAQARHSLDTYIQSIADKAPELTPEQAARLRAILTTTREGA